MHLYIALINAYFDADILHRDISPKNIIITKDGKGRLTDWDLCRPKHRTGTYTQGYTVGTSTFSESQFLMNTEGYLANCLCPVNGRSIHEAP